jgi:hypothetical protein
MNPQFKPSPKPKSASTRPPERVAGVPLQEQLTGPACPNLERTAAEVLAERLAQADAFTPAALFVP